MSCTTMAILTDYTISKVVASAVFFFQLDFAACSELLFQVDVAFDAGRPLSGYTRRFDARNALDCARTCSTETDCGSFFFTARDMDCQLHPEVLVFDDVKDNLEPISGVKYYVNVATLCPTTTPTTTTPIPFACPVSGGTWTPVRIPGEHLFYISIFTDSMVSKSTAEAMCSSIDGTVLKILTEDKMVFFQNVVFDCEETKNFNFWLDGSNADASNFTADDAWRTSQDEAIPMTQGKFWVEGRPNDPTTHHCMRAWGNYNFLFDDIACYMAQMVMCEKRDNTE